MTAYGFECSVDLGGGKPLIPEVNGDAGVACIGKVFSCLGHLGDERLQLVHKAMDALGLAAVVSGKMQRIADDDAGATVTARQAEDGALVAAGLRALDGEQGLCNAERVGERNTDAARADV